MSKQNFYQSGLNTLWTDGEWNAYQSGTAIHYANEEVGCLKHWLFARRGFIALGVLPGNAPLKPDFGLDAWFGEGYHDDDCPHCGGPAIVDDWGEGGRRWCEKCGIAPLD